MPSEIPNKLGRTVLDSNILYPGLFWRF